MACRKRGRFGLDPVRKALAMFSLFEHCVSKQLKWIIQILRNRMQRRGSKCSCFFLSHHHKDGRLMKGAIDAAMEFFIFKSNQIKGIRRKVRPSVINPNVWSDYPTKNKVKWIQKKNYNDQDVQESIWQVPLSQWKTLRSLSSFMKIPRLNMGQMRQKG